MTAVPRVAFLSMDSLDGFNCSDHLLVPPFEKAGWRVDTVSWRDRLADWNRFAAVIVRSPWDYQDDPAAFMDVLGTIDASRARLANDLALMKWNLDKRYLRDVEARGLAIVPTLWAAEFDPTQAENAFDRFAVDTIVVKPVVAAGAADAFRLTRSAFAAQHETLARLFTKRPHMI